MSLSGFCYQSAPVSHKVKCGPLLYCYILRYCLRLLLYPRPFHQFLVTWSHSGSPNNLQIHRQQFEEIHQATATDILPTLSYLGYGTSETKAPDVFMSHTIDDRALKTAHKCACVCFDSPISVHSEAVLVHGKHNDTDALVVVGCPLHSGTKRKSSEPLYEVRYNLMATPDRVNM